MKFWIFALLGAFWLLPNSGAFAQSKPKPDPRIKELTNVLYGFYSNQRIADAVANPAFLPQRLVVYPIWKDQPETWAYFGWFSPQFKQRALDEAILKIYVENDQLYAMWYRIPEPDRFQAEWEKPKPFAGLTPDDLTHSARCTVAPDEKGYRMRSETDMERLDQISAYKWMQFDMSFFKEGFRSDSRFLAADKTPVIVHSRMFLIDKVSKTVKTFK